MAPRIAAAMREPPGSSRRNSAATLSSSWSSPAGTAQGEMSTMPGSGSCAATPFPLGIEILVTSRLGVLSVMFASRAGSTSWPCPGRDERAEQARRRRRVRRVAIAEREYVPVRAGQLRGLDTGMASRPERQVRQRGDAETRGDERVHGYIIIGREGDPGGKAGLRALPEQVAAAPLAARDPAVLGIGGQCLLRAVGRLGHQVDGLVEQQGATCAVP